MDKAIWKPIPWIFFDLDDTIWNFSANSILSLHTLYSNSPILRKLFHSVEEFIEIYHTNNSLMWELYSQGKVSTKELKVERWRRTLATKTFEVLTAVCEELDHYYLETLAKQQEMIPGMKELLEKLSKKSMLAVLSNGFSKTQYKKLQFSGLWKYISRTIVSEELGFNKPNHKLFEYAINETGALPPYLMIGDHPSTDILGAMKSGWHAIWFNPDNKPWPFSNKQLEEEGVDPHALFAIVNTSEELYDAIIRFFGQED